MSIWKEQAVHEGPLLQLPMHLLEAIAAHMLRDSMRSLSVYSHTAANLRSTCRTFRTVVDEVAPMVQVNRKRKTLCAYFVLLYLSPDLYDYDFLLLRSCSSRRSSSANLRGCAQLDGFSAHFHSWKAFRSIWDRSMGDTVWRKLHVCALLKP